MTSKTAKYIQDRETKGALRYQEVYDNGVEIPRMGDDCLVGSIYIRKAALGADRPKAIKVTIEYRED